MDVVTSLVDDGLVDSEKIGTSIYFWAFPSKASQARRSKLEKVKEERDKVRDRLAAMTKEAQAPEEKVRALVDGLHECHDAFAPCADEGCDWKFGPWGEDVFVQRCMDHHYVDKVEAFDLTKDGACASDRPKDQKKNMKWKSPDCSQEAGTAASIHPFKKPQEYFKCMSEIMKDNYDVRALGHQVMSLAACQRFLCWRR